MEMSDETNTEIETPAAAAPVEAAPAVAAVPEREMVMCMVSKQKVPLDETVEIERKKGELLRVHARYKRFES